MNKQKVHLVAAVMAAFAWSSAYGEELKPDLRQLIAHSLQHNGALKAFREEKGIHEAAIIRADTLPNPTLEMEGSSGALTGSFAESGISLGISQELLMAGKRANRLASAEKSLEAFRWQTAERERMLREEVATTFYAKLLAAERAALTESSIKANQQLLEVALQRLQAGDIPELEVNLIRVEMARSESAHIGALRNLSQSRLKLQLLTGAQHFDTAAAEGSLSALSPMNMSLDELKQLALSNRPDIKAMAAEKSKNETDILLARAEGIPNLTAGLTFRRDTSSLESGGREERDTAYTIGLKLSMPLPVFDRNRAGLLEASTRRSKSEFALHALTDIIAQEVESAYAEFQNTDRILTLYRANILSQLEENLKLTNEAYRLGEVGILAVIQEQKKFFEVKDGYLSALHDRQMALVKLESTVATDLHGGVQ